MAKATATVQNASGIHCRPSAVIIKEMEDYSGEMAIETANGDCDLRSILGLISLGLEPGAEVEITVSGPDDEATASKLVELFERHYDYPPRD